MWKLSFHLHCSPKYTFGMRAHVYLNKGKKRKTRQTKKKTNKQQQEQSSNEWDNS